MKEHDIQVALMKWMSFQHKEAFEVTYATPNAAKRTPRQGAYMKAEGLKSGVPDICIAVPKKGFGALYIELKRKGGKLTPNQAEWITKLTEAGNMAVLCVGYDAAKDTIDSYLSD